MPSVEASSLLPPRATLGFATDRAADGPTARPNEQPEEAELRAHPGALIPINKRASASCHQSMATARQLQRSLDGGSLTAPIETSARRELGGRAIRVDTRPGHPPTVGFQQ